jgi:hypothetical protein
MTDLLRKGEEHESVRICLLILVVYSASEVASQARGVGATFARIRMEDATNFTLGLTGRCDCSVPLLAPPALCACTNPERLPECFPYVRDPRRCRNMTMRPP